MEKIDKHIMVELVSLKIINEHTRIRDDQVGKLMEKSDVHAHQFSDSIVIEET